MKKLFLYMLIAVFIFFSFFTITEEYFYQKLKKEKLEEQMLIKEDETTAATTAIEEAEALAMREYDDIEYIVSIKDDYVIVYESDGNTVYEYTGIDALVIKNLYPDLYMMLEQNLYFYSREELFEFLQSISS